MKYCYNCGIELDRKSKTAEHIPAKTTFNGYSEEYKINRITVPACYECNQEYSKIDQEVRDAIGIMNENDSKQEELTKKAVKSVLSKPDAHERLHLQGNKVVGISFDYGTLEKLHVKNFKGLYYKKYGHPLPEKYIITVFAEGDEFDQKLTRNASYFYSYLMENDNWEYSGHLDIFRYKFKSFAPTQDGKVCDSINLDECFGFACCMAYHKKLFPLVLALDEEKLIGIQQSR